jgi:hypothetical protein
MSDLLEEDCRLIFIERYLEALRYHLDTFHEISHTLRIFIKPEVYLQASFHFLFAGQNLS